MDCAIPDRGGEFSTPRNAFSLVSIIIEYPNARPRSHVSESAATVRWYPVLAGLAAAVQGHRGLGHRRGARSRDMPGADRPRLTW